MVGFLVVRDVHTHVNSSTNLFRAVETGQGHHQQQLAEVEL